MASRVANGFRDALGRGVKSELHADEHHTRQSSQPQSLERGGTVAVIKTEREAAGNEQGQVEPINRFGGQVI